MNHILKFVGLLSIIFISLSAVAESNSDEFLVVERWDEIEVDARVQKIDLKSRKVTLMGPEGNLMTITAGDGVKRLNEIKVGDIVAVEYTTYMAAELRKPTAAEEKEPLIIIADAGKAPAGMPPGAEVGAIVQAVVSIEIINRPFSTVTIKGPRGNYVTIPVEDEELLTEVKVGQKIIMTYAESIAVSLVKVK
ncbi:MAG: hypothetical protein KAJ39_08750 [Gammaproteobacteria bacterium]|nr:hypothetical protein [Gammaproteobacteria bacterium]